jgi:hypothetical protein
VKKRILLAAFVACLSLSTTVAAGDWATGSGSCYARGDKYLDIGVALPMFVLGTHVAFDYGFHDAISGGGGIGFRYYYYGAAGYPWDAAYITFLGRAAFHPFNLKVWADKIKVRDKLDVWVGPTFWIAPMLNGVPFDWGVREYLGARWHFTPKIGVFLEDCGGFGYIDGGLTIQL